MTLFGKEYQTLTSNILLSSESEFLFLVLLSFIDVVLHIHTSELTFVGLLLEQCKAKYHA